MPLGRPLYEPTLETRFAIAHRDIEGLKRRGAGRWVYVGTYPTDPNTIDISPPFQSGFVNNGDGTSAADQLTRFRWLLGGGVEIQINVTGGGVGLIIFSLPDKYWEGGKQTFAAVDIAGNFQCYTVVPNGAGADVYMGRI
jgi:hypothetical protein